MTNEMLFVMHIAMVMWFVVGSLLLGRGALVASVVMQGVLANLFVGKQMALFGLSVTCADAYVVGAVLSLSLLQEYFGERAASEATWAYLFFAMWYVVMTRIHLAYEPLWADRLQLHFESVFDYAMQVTIASIVAMASGLWINRHVLSVFDKRSWGPMWSRVLVALVVSQLFDTALFAFIGLRGMVVSLWQVMVVSLLVKVAAGLVATPFVGVARWVLKQSEGYID